MNCRVAAQFVLPGVIPHQQGSSQSPFVFSNSRMRVSRSCAVSVGSGVKVGVEEGVGVRVGVKVGLGGVGEGIAVGSDVSVDGSSSREAVARGAVSTGVGDEGTRNTHPELSRVSTPAHKTRLICLPFISPPHIPRVIYSPR